MRFKENGAHGQRVLRNCQLYRFQPQGVRLLPMSRTLSVTVTTAQRLHVGTGTGTGRQDGLQLPSCCQAVLSGSQSEATYGNFYHSLARVAMVLQ